ncbi:MAG TPA: copper chaperone PCu(A)C [Streptosporangiaceae bacterium]|jgi:copper(I)-binding protein
MLTPRRRPPALTAVLAGCALAAALGTAGCAAKASADQTQTAAIQAATAYVPLPITPGATDVYLAIRNNGARDSLISARLSTGGRVSFRTPAAGGAMRTVPAIAIPADTILRLVPDGPHLAVAGAGAMHNGKLITLTLRFRHAGVLSVSALVTNPQDTGGNNAYMNMD